VYLKQHDLAEANSEFEAELQTDQGCSLAVLGKVRLSLDAGSNAEAIVALKEFWGHDQGFVQAAAPLLAEGISEDRRSGFLEYLAQQNGSGAIPDDLYKSLSGAFKGVVPTYSKNSPTSKTSGNSSSKKAEELYASGYYGQCTDRLKRNLVSESANELSLLANCSYWTGDYDLTSKASARLLAKQPHSVDALYWSIKANEKLAFQSLEQFQQLEPDSATNHVLFGDILRQRRQYSEAEAEYQKALQISPDDHAALLGLASAYNGDGYNAKTIETVRAALLQSPDDPELNLLMAEALVASYKFSDAEPFLKKSLGVKQQMLPHVHALLGDVYAKTGRPQQGIDQLKMGLKSDDDGQVHYLLAHLYLERGDTKDAALAFEQMKVIRQQSRERSDAAFDESN
jgi:tetratricopeptide (TPR) repeat protein